MLYRIHYIEESTFCQGILQNFLRFFCRFFYPPEGAADISPPLGKRPPFKGLQQPQ